MWFPMNRPWKSHQFEPVQRATLELIASDSFDELIGRLHPILSRLRSFRLLAMLKQPAPARPRFSSHLRHIRNRRIAPGFSGNNARIGLLAQQGLDPGEHLAIVAADSALVSK